MVFYPYTYGFPKKVTEFLVLNIIVYDTKTPCFHTIMPLYIRIIYT